MQNTVSTQQDLRYPVGKLHMPASISEEDRTEAIRTLEELPEQLRQALRGLDEEQLDTPYREGGWSVRQLVHHLADSHGIAFIRMRRALTEDWPEVRGYDEKAFALLADSTAPVEWSLALLENLHARWVTVLGAMQAAEWQRGYRHNERGPMALDQVLLLYAWHSRHHLAHLTHLRARSGW